MGPASIESHYDEALAVPGLLEVIREDQQADAFVLACFGDPGLDAAREAASRPVIGIAEAAMKTASLLGRSFSVVTTMSRTVGRAWDLTRTYGLERQCAGVHACDIPVLELEEDQDRTYAVILAFAKNALAADGSRRHRARVRRDGRAARAAHRAARRAGRRRCRRRHPAGRERGAAGAATRPPTASSPRRRRRPTRGAAGLRPLTRRRSPALDGWFQRASNIASAETLDSTVC